MHERSSLHVYIVAHQSEHEGGLPLNTFSKNVPPGRRSGNPKYPIRLYVQLLRLWWRQTEVSETACGPTIAGRLRGTALQVALALSRDRLDLTTGTRRIFTGDDLLTEPAHPEWTDTLTGEVHPAEYAGDGCAICDSKYHWENECPMNQQCGMELSDPSGEHWQEWADDDWYEDWDEDPDYSDYFGKGKKGKYKGFRRKGKGKGFKGFKGKRKFGHGKGHKGKNKFGGYASSTSIFDEVDHSVFMTSQSSASASSPMPPDPWSAYLSTQAEGVSTSAVAKGVSTSARFQEGVKPSWPNYAAHGATSQVSASTSFSGSTDM